jgi:hypothetical protein
MHVIDAPGVTRRTCTPEVRGSVGIRGVERRYQILDHRIQRRLIRRGEYDHAGALTAEVLNQVIDAGGGGDGRGGNLCHTLNRVEHVVFSEEGQLLGVNNGGGAVVRARRRTAQFYGGDVIGHRGAGAEGAEDYQPRDYLAYELAAKG